MALYEDSNNLANGADDQAVRELPPTEDILGLDGDIEDAGGEFELSDEEREAVGRTMFDMPSSKDNTVTILMPQDRIGDLPLQSLVRIKSSDDRSYLGAVVEGPFAEPDGLRADAPVVVISAVNNSIFMPRFHGRAQVELLGEEQGISMLPPQYRPKPNSFVYAVSDKETETFLKAGGDLRLGQAVGHGNLNVGIPSDDKNGMPRHLGIIGTTGGGKSNTVAVLLKHLQKAGYATVVLDTEGEYTRANEATSQDSRVEMLLKRGLQPEGIDSTVVYYLVGRETTNPDHPKHRDFSPRFAELSPHAVSEILSLTDPQKERFLQAYDAVKLVMADRGIFPRRGNQEDQRARLELDELETGYPQITLGYVMDMVGAVLAKLSDSLDEWSPLHFAAEDANTVKHRANEGVRSGNEVSWRALMGKLAQLYRLRIFDQSSAQPLEYDHLRTAGRVSIIDLSDSDSPQVNNLVIAGVLRGVQKAQDTAYEEAKKNGQLPTPVAIIIEEAHEFLSDQRISQMPVLFQQVARIVRRGRKRWLGLVFVTQLPQHLPDEVLGLINNYIFHKLSDANVITRLRRSVGNVDESLWRRLPGLAPGQAVVSLSTMSRPLLVSIDPASCKLGFED